MQINTDNLSQQEIIILKLRELFADDGYLPYKMSNFEPYDLYSANKSFLKSGKVITFNDAGGRLMALKPDVTISIIKNTKPTDTTSKLYYHENVFRMQPHEKEYKEIPQMGIEYIGGTGMAAEVQVAEIAVKSLKLMGSETVLTLSHMGFVSGLCESLGSSQLYIDALQSKNIGILLNAAEESGWQKDRQDALHTLITAQGGYKEQIETAKTLCINSEMETALAELSKLYDILSKTDHSDILTLDFSMIGDIEYYNGIIFRGYLRSIPHPVLFGGRYDNLMKRFNKPQPAIGFAVYLAELEQTTKQTCDSDNGSEPDTDKRMLNVALPKGRLGNKVYKMLSDIGYECPEILCDNRRLIFENSDKNVRYLLVKPGDVAIYVERGAADIGVVGRDILLETAPDVYELVDLDIGKCRLAVAAMTNFCEDKSLPLRVATKYPNVARSHYDKQSRRIEIIKLSGSIELAPILNLSHVIVDIVETGATLHENNLEVIEDIEKSSAFLIANKSSYRFFGDEINAICERLKDNL